MRQDPNRGPAPWSRPFRDPSLLLAAVLVAACNGEDDFTLITAAVAQWHDYEWLAKSLPEEQARPLREWALLINSPQAAQQPCLFEQAKVGVQRGSADFAIMGEAVLRREAAVIGIEAITQMPQDNLGRRLQPPLLDRPGGCLMAHDVTLRVGRTRQVKP